MSESILVISPHPDDAEFGAGGSIVKWVREGRDVFLAVCTNGDKGSNDPDMTSAKLAKIRRKEQQAAAKVLGFQEVVFLDYPDGGLEDTSEFRGKLVHLIRRYKPYAMAAPDPYRRYISHRDHRIGGTVALDAAFPYSRNHLFYPQHIAEGLEPHNVAEMYFWRPDEPNYHVDISDVFELKLKAVLCHKSQVHAPRIEAVMRERARELGKEKGIPLAEAFYRIKLPG